MSEFTPEISIQRQEINFPHGQSAIELFRKEFGDSPEKVELFEKVVGVFFDQEMRNTQIFTDSKGASLPYTKVNLTELAREVIGLQSPVSDEKYKERHEKKFFVLPSFPALQNGHQFTFVEVSMMQAIKQVPGIIESLKKGETPEDIEIFTLGSPTNKFWGEIPQAYLDELKGDAYKTVGETYSELVKQELGETESAELGQSVVIYGQSMSSSLAAATAEALIDSSVATQSNEERKEGKPFIQVLMDAPVSLNPSKFRKFQISLGFILDPLIGGLNKQTLKAVLGEGPFLEKVANSLLKRGILTDTDPESAKRKIEARTTLVKAMLGKSMPVDSSRVKVNIRRGLYDSTVNSLGFVKNVISKLRKNKSEGNDSIGSFLIKEKDLDIKDTPDKSSRVSFVKDTHAFADRYSKSAIKKWGRYMDRILSVMD